MADKSNLIAALTSIVELMSEEEIKKEDEMNRLLPSASSEHYLFLVRVLMSISKMV